MQQGDIVDVNRKMANIVWDKNDTKVYASSFVSDIIKSAEKSIKRINNYINVNTLVWI